eukprot:73533_1
MNNTHHKYTNDQVEILFQVFRFGNILSGLLSMFIIVSFISFRSLRSLTFKIILCVAISDFIYSIGGVMVARQPGTLCTIQAVLNQFGIISSVLWVDVITWTLYHLAVTKTCGCIPKLSFIKMNLIVWGLSFITVLIGFGSSSFGPSEGHCWIVHHFLRFVLFYIPLWMSIIYIHCVLIIVFRKLNKKKSPYNNITNSYNARATLIVAGYIRNTKQLLGHNIVIPHNINILCEEYYGDNTTKTIDISDQTCYGNYAMIPMTATHQPVYPHINYSDDHHSDIQQYKNRNRKKNATWKRMIYFPLILVLCFTGWTVRRIWDAATNNNSPFWLALLSMGLGSLFGCLDSLVYGCTKDVKMKWKCKRFKQTDITDSIVDPDETTTITILFDHESHQSVTPMNVDNNVAIFGWIIMYYININDHKNIILNENQCKGVINLVSRYLGTLKNK